MKKISIILSLLILGTVFYSCKKDDVKTYSCNPKVDNWVKQNIQNIENISYDDLVTYKLEYQKGIFQAASPDQRYAYWKEKLKRILSLDWNKDEIAFISKLNDSINSSWYEDDIDTNEFNNIDLFLQNWKNEGLNSLNFPIEILHAIAGRIDYDVDPVNPQKLMGTNFSTYGGGVFYGGGVSATKDCECSKKADFCTSTLECKSAECEETAHGCGWVWTYKCTGNCQ